MLKWKFRIPRKESSIIYNEPSEIQGLSLTSKNIQKVLGDSDDFIIRPIPIGFDKRITVTLIYIEGMVDSTQISDYILKPLTEKEISEAKTTKEIMDLFQEGSLYFSRIKKIEDINNTISEIISGSAALVIDDEKMAFVFEARGFEKRSIDLATEENVLKGPKAAFVEDLRVNTTLVRRLIRTPNLVFEETEIGKQSGTKVGIVYIKGLTNQNLIAEVKKRLDSINTDLAFHSSYIKESIRDAKYTLFPQIIQTEMPSKFCRDIIEGKIGLLIDGNPFSMILPSTFVDMFKIPLDYEYDTFVVSCFRILRYVLYAITLVLPAFYVSISSFHQEMIPTTLALSLAKAKQGVPFPVFIEVLLTLLAFYSLLMASIGVWKTIGNTVSIVGALVLGEAVIVANFVSPGAVVVVAIAAISSLAIPNFELTACAMVWQFFLLLFASFLGLFGLFIGLLLMLLDAARIEVLGVPFLFPLVANDGLQMEDTLFRLPLKSMKKRPFALKTMNKKRRG